MKAKAKNWKKIGNTQVYEPMVRMKTTFIKKEKPGAEQRISEPTKPERLMGRVTKKKELEGHQRKFWISSNVWKNYGHFF